MRGEDKSAAHLLATPVIPLATALIIGGSLFGYFIGTGDHGAAPSSPIAAQKPPVKSLSTESLLSPLPLGEMAAMFAPDAGRASAESSAAVSGLVGAGRASGPRLASDFPVIYFASGRAIIPAGDRNLVDQAARLVRQLPAGSLVEIAGYTDRTGIPAANLRLSQRRARAVLEALTRMGAAPARLTAKGYGVYVQTAARQTRALEGRSNAPAEDPQPGRRRVEFHVIHP
ncbi:MAG: OmpA family protein [Methylocapsa sp.]|nr:OmpA family protein [Methylocapsa sp.]